MAERYEESKPESFNKGFKLADRIKQIKHYRLDGRAAMIRTPSAIHAR